MVVGVGVPGDLLGGAGGEGSVSGPRYSLEGVGAVARPQGAQQHVVEPQ